MSEGQQSCSSEERGKQVKIKTNVKAGGMQINHNQSGLALKTAVKAGGTFLNHNQSGLTVKTALKAGRIATNHNQNIATRTPRK